MYKKALEKGAIIITPEDVVAFDKDNQRLINLITRKLKGMLFGICLLVVLSCVLVFGYSTPRIGDIGLFDEDGGVTAVHPKHNVKQNNLSAFRYAIDAVTQIRTFRFRTWFDDILASEHLFTPEAYNSYVDLLDTSGLLVRIKEEKLNVTAVPTSNTPINALRRFESTGIFYYVNVDLHVRTESPSGVDVHSRENILIKLQEVERGISPSGFLIASIDRF